MQFRWVVFISLWTLLSAPVFDAAPPSERNCSQRKPAISAAAKMPMEVRKPRSLVK
jgi:hypothetical protein